MNTTELQNAKDGALTFYETFNYQAHYVGLAVTPPVHPTNFCDTIEDWTQAKTWLPISLTNNYQTAPNVLNPFTPLVSTTTCLDLAGSGDVPGPHTNLGDPMKAAMNELMTNGRPGATKGIVFLTDGAANIMDATGAALVGATGPCDYAMKMADQAKANGIEIYTIGYGTAGEICKNDTPASPWYNKTADQLLEAMATDSTHFYKQPKTSDLDPIFETIGLQIGGSTKLIK
jgi:hypothetical protein